MAETPPAGSPPSPPAPPSPTSPPPPASPPPAPPPPAPPTGGVKFAGKYDSPEKFHDGLRNIYKAVNGFELPAGVSLYGDNGIFGKDVAEAEQRYAAMDKAYNARTPSPPSPPPPPGSGNTDPMKLGGENTEEIPAMLAKAGLDPSALEKQFLETGDLSADQYAAIRKARPSLTNADIKHIAEGMAAKAQLAAQTQAQIKSEAAAMVGGDQQLDSLLKWAGTKYQGAERADMDRRLGNPALAKGAIAQILAEHRAAVGAGSAQPLIGGGATQAPAINTPSELFAMQKRAESGDQSALAAIKAIPLDRYAELMSRAV